MTRSSLSLLLLLAYPTAALAAPLAPAAEPPPLAPAPPLAPQTVAVRAPSPLPQLGLGALQLVGGYGVGIGGTLGLMEAGFNPKAYGARSDYANLVHVGALAPALAGGAVCGLGYLSRRYRGRCWTAVLGAYAGAVAGTLLGVLLAPAPGPDDTVEFSRAMSGIAGVMLFAPIGGVLGWHLGKQEVIEPVD
jgi:hypothetical protein